MSTLVSRHEVHDRQKLEIEMNYEVDPATMRIELEGKTVLFESIGSDSTMLTIGAVFAMLVKLNYDLDYTEFP